jgi:hypothetical protein
MARPALKCPFLSQLTLQQVRASAPHILNAGIESCPIFSQYARKISTSNVQHSNNLSSSTARPLSLDEIKAVHEKILEQRNQQYLTSQVKATTPTMKTTLNDKKPSPYGESKQKIKGSIFLKLCFVFEVIVSAECEDLLCPFLKSTPITLRRVNMDQDTIEVNRKLGILSLPINAEFHFYLYR